MQFELNDDQALLRTSTRELLEKEAPLATTRAIMEESAEGYSKTFFRQLGGLGYLELLQGGDADADEQRGQEPGGDQAQAEVADERAHAAGGAEAERDVIAERRDRGQDGHGRSHRRRAPDSGIVLKSPAGLERAGRRCRMKSKTDSL